MARSTHQYKAAPQNSDEDLRLALIRLAKHYGRYGYRKIAELLRVEGWRVNHKKVEHLWCEEGLQLPHRHKKRKRRRTYHCQRRSKISPPGRSKTSPLNVMRYAVLGGCPGSP